MTRDEWDALVILAGGFDGLPERLIRDHVPNRHGRCRGCELPQSAGSVFPCSLYRLAVAAIESRDSAAIIPFRAG